jgi:hypothetical protein
LPIAQDTQAISKVLDVGLLRLVQACQCSPSMGDTVYDGQEPRKSTATII